MAESEPEPVPAPIVCIGCGTANPPGAEACSGCGHRFAGPSGEPVPGVPPRVGPRRVEPPRELRPPDAWYLEMQSRPKPEGPWGDVARSFGVVIWALVVVCLVIVAAVVAFFATCLGIGSVAGGNNSVALALLAGGVAAVVAALLTGTFLIRLGKSFFGDRNRRH